MERKRVALYAAVIGALMLGACIFQNDPLKPNNPPIIEYSSPPQRYLSFTAPDSCLFSIRAVDEDGDAVMYEFVIGDSLLGSADTVMFFASDSGDYHLQGLARDGEAVVERSWFITVDEDYNEPPFIIGYLPAQQEVACLVGETLVFTFSVIDDDLENVQYSFELAKIGEIGVRRFYGSSTLEHRFLERGDFTLKGMVWDGEYGDTIMWHIGVTGDPDTIAPAAILDLEGDTGEDLGSVWLTWTATGDDGYSGAASAYEVRTSTEPILTEEDWSEASRKNNMPVPAPSGSTEEVVVRALNPGTYVYVMMRAIDDFFNYSPLGNCIQLLVRGIDATGTVINMHTGGPLEGVFVVSHGRSDTTDATGVYLLKNLPYYMSVIRVQDEHIPGSIGEYYDCEYPVYNPNQTIEYDFYVMPALGIQNTGNDQVYDNRFILFFKGVTETSGRFGKSTVYHAWNHWPLTVYNPEKMLDDLDLQEAARGAMEEWEVMTERDLFVEVAEEWEADVRIIYDDVQDRKHHYETLQWNTDGTPKIRGVFLYTMHTGAPLSRFSHAIIAHELGHVLGFLAHSDDPGHLMLGLTRPSQEHVTTDEANVIKIIYSVPFIYNFGTVIEE